jgi:hypothetical protein
MKKLILILFVLPCLAKAQLTPIHDSVLASDGKYLQVDVYRPGGCTQCPTILIQTPYGKYLFAISGLPLGVHYNINSSNYNFVVADWRGFYANAGAAYSGSPSRGRDGKDIVQWIAAQSWSDGKVGTWGPSALGVIQYETAYNYPPNLVCICPLVAAPQTYYNDYYPGGCLRTEYIEQLDGLGYGLSPLVEQYPVHNLIWQYGIENPSWYPDSIPVPALMIGGWYDHNVDQMLSFFNAIRAQSPANVRNQHKLLMGPWEHGGSSTAHVGSANQGELMYTNAANWNDSLALLFFDYHMRGINNNWNAQPYINYYQMGENTRQTSSVWPVPGLSNVNYYFHDDLTMDNTAPATPGNSLSYAYDPNNPSPTIGGATLKAGLLQGPWRQDTAVENRNDILVFSTAPLTQNVVMKGKAQVHLKASSDKTDTDFDVRLCDVDPGGRSMLVQTGVLRMRYRNGFNATDTAALVPGTIYTGTVDLAASCITFLAGHRIRVDISSSNYPQYNRNMNTGKAMYPGNSPDSLINPVTANNTVYLNSTDFSYITLPLDLAASVNEIGPAGNIDLFPNPAKDLLTVEFGKEISGTIVVSDISGRNLLKTTVNGTAAQLQTERLGNGIYFLQVETGGKSFTKKFVIAR